LVLGLRPGHLTGLHCIWQVESAVDTLQHQKVASSLKSFHDQYIPQLILGG
jgi:hypothetical protein